MKRIIFWLLSTITIVTLLFGYRTSTQGAVAGTDQSVVATGTTSGTSTSSSSTSSSGTSGSSGSGSGSGSSSSTTVKGSVVQTQWGPVQVQVTIANGKITNVTVLQHPTGNPKDEEINARALPILVQETLSKQSASIDMVSGATVTSNGYIQSLQSALDQAGL